MKNNCLEKNLLVEFIEFRWGQYFEFFMYHLLFLGLFGPFLFFLFYIKPGKYILYNMLFITPLKLTFNQIYLFLANLCIYYFYINYDF
jgi:hypothetical protein